MQITTIGSGSKGNSLLLKAGQTRVLVDAGLSFDEMVERLNLLLEEPSKISAIVVTHTHGDHIRAVRRFSDRYHVPIYAHEKALGHPSLRRTKRKNPFLAEQSFRIGDCEFFPVSLPHDSDPTFAFAVEAEGKRFGIATDLGHPAEVVAQGLGACDALLLEFNHDRRMLLEGPYPWSLKNRVAGDLGHLSNEQSAVLLRLALQEKLQHLILGHLSETNNRPEIANEVAQRILVGEGMEKRVVVVTAPQHQPGKTLIV